MVYPRVPIYQWVPTINFDCPYSPISRGGVFPCAGKLPMVDVNDKPLIVMPCHSSHPAVTSYYSLDFKGKTTPLASLKASTDVSIYAANASKIFYITHFIVSLIDTYRPAFIGFKFAKYMHEKSFLYCTKQL
jgi:hypothetical protein